jgi:hypothetical protein
MNFLNMFSDEAPISNNGYRSSLYTDPSIKQGVDFLNYEKKITNNLTGNLRLISQTDGSNLGSGQVINGKIYEGMETGGGGSGGGSVASPAPAPAPPPPTAAASAAAASPAGPAAPVDPEKQFKKEVMDEIKNKDIEYLEMSYDVVNLLYEDILKKFRKDYQGGLANAPVGPDEIAVPGQRSQIIKEIKNIETSLGIISVEISEVVKKRSKANIEAYYTIMEQIRVVKSQIIDTNNQIEELTKIVDPVSAVAEREETHTLSKQRYYMYIFWFIIAAIVIYVTIVNMINPNASFSVLVVCIIILVCIFGFIMYTNITGAWYNDIKNGISGISIPRMENSFQNMFNFDPLVSIKYTS